MARGGAGGVQAPQTTQQVAFLTGERQIELRTVPIPTPGPGELVVRVVAATTCGTDLKMYRRGHPLFPFPTPFGHEFAGTVHATGGPGPLGAPRFEVGDAVMAVHSVPCGTCRACRGGLANLCDTLVERMALGAYGQYIRLSARHVAIHTFAKPADLPFAEAALLEPLSCVVYGASLLDWSRFERHGITPTALVYGGGPIAQMYVRLLTQVYGARVVVVARREAPRQLALTMGATAAVAPADDESALRSLPDLDGGSATADRLADIAIDATGQPAIWERCVALTAPGGQVLFYGGAKSGTTLTLDTRHLHYDQLTLRGVFHFTPDAVRAAYDHLTGAPDDRLDLRPLIGPNPTPLRSLATLYEQLDSGQANPKEVVVPGT